MAKIVVVVAIVAVGEEVEDGFFPVQR